MMRSQEGKSIMADIKADKSSDPAEAAYAAAAEAIAAIPGAPIATGPLPVPPASEAAPVETKPAEAKAAEFKVAESKPAPIEPAKAEVAKPKPPVKPVEVAKVVAPAKEPAAKSAAKPKPAKAVKPASKPKKAAIRKLPAVAKTPPVKKSKETPMATQKSPNISDTIKHFATDAKIKAQEAVTKAQVVLDEAGALTKGNVEAVSASGKVLAVGLKGLGTQYVAEGKSAFETIKADAKKLATVKSPADLFVLQSELLKRNLDTMLSFGAKNSAAMFKLAGDALAPVTARAGQVAAQLKKAA
jgi:hypothetical protein